MDNERMLASALATLKEHTKRREERWASMTPEAGKQECRDFLVRLGTHNPDGTLTPQYGGPDQ